MGERMIGPGLMKISSDRGNVAVIRVAETVNHPTHPHAPNQKL
jgi:hypothetical protein